MIQPVSVRRGDGLSRAEDERRRTVASAADLIERVAARLDGLRCISCNSSLVGAPDSIGGNLDESRRLLEMSIERSEAGDWAAAEELAEAAVNLSGEAMRLAGLGAEWGRMMAESAFFPRQSGPRIPPV